MNKGATVMTGKFENLQIIAAPGNDEEEAIRKATGTVPFHTHVYQHVGFEPFAEGRGPRVMMSLGRPGPVLQDIKTQLLALRVLLTTAIGSLRSYGKPGDKDKHSVTVPAFYPTFGHR
jgi:hypothetical protein